MPRGCLHYESYGRKARWCCSAARCSGRIGNSNSSLHATREDLMFSTLLSVVLSAAKDLTEERHVPVAA